MKRLLSLLACFAMIGAAHAQSFNCTCAYAVPNTANATKDKIDFVCTNLIARPSFDPSKEQAKYAQLKDFCVQQVTQSTAACGPTDAECVKQGYRASEGAIRSKCDQLCKMK
jgi:hypothetical protein